MDYEYINAMRIQSGLTNKAIAKTKTLSESTVSRFFNGEIKSPDCEMARSIFDAIGASADRAFGLVKPIDTAVTEPTPDLKAVTHEVIDSLPPLVDEEKVAEKVAQAVAESPLVSTPIDAHALAQEIVAMLPKPQPVECDSCRSARVYESTINLQTKIISALGGCLGLMFLVITAILIFK